MEYSKGFGKYYLGTSYPIERGLTPPRALHLQAINWGAPIVELQGAAGEVGKTGREVIKELAKANEIKLTWHAPPTEQYELAYPNERVNEQAKILLKEGIKYAKEIGAEVINLHPTNILSRPGPDTIYLWQNHYNEPIAYRIPEYEKGKPIKELIEEREKRIKSEIVQAIEFHDEWAERYRKNAENFELIANALKSWDTALPIEKETAKMKAMELGYPPEAVENPELRKKILENVERLRDTYRKRFEAEKNYVLRWAEQFSPFLEKRKLPGIDMEIGTEKPKRMIEPLYSKVIENFAKNFAEVAEEAIKNKIKIAIENTDSRFMFSTPQELKDLLEAVYRELEKRGIKRDEAKKYVGTTFDFGHAATLKHLRIRVVDPKTLEEREVRIRTPVEYAEKLEELGVPIIHVHAHENFGDIDAHLPLGEAFPEEVRKKLMEFLEKKGFKGKIIFEPGPIGGLGYAISLRATAPELYHVYGIPTEILGGPSYHATDIIVDPLHFKKKESYFYGSWVGDLF